MTSTPVPVDEPAARQAVFRRSMQWRYWPLIPAALLFVFIFVVPVGEVAIWSVRGEDGWTLANFAPVLSDGAYRTILLSTLRLSMTVGIACVILGYPVAYFLVTRSPRQQRLLLLFITIPLWVSVLIRTYSWIVLLGREGLVNSLVAALGLSDTPLHLLYTRGAVYAAMIQVLLPIAILTMFSSMSTINRSLLSAARILGATPARAFVKVFMPLSASGAVSAGMLTFVLALGFFITPALVGGPKDSMIANLIAQQISETLDWGLGSALGMTLLVAGLIVVAAASILLRRFTALTTEGGSR
ncbi:putative spermidine/putrescine transport system permease protein [Paraburkholderia sp. BL6665CI2N2]|uniref:ABC transporter permease n=1 Tax=Paraburkholderia sp. BL6665CI2N2 TaxID=1938806 RepID=UPI0010CFDF6C|nr:ABC transporter permease [Paraburkholderia sp. BL6665CI2N2]TDY16843.1 putative spermidine/putrescine transport system permease protein [Paraburkholderia sp. BL6665CI2N2]